MFYSQLIDILAELSEFEFPSIGSLMPDPDGSPQPVVGPILSMSAPSLHLPPHPTLTSAENNKKYPSSLVSGRFVEPPSDVTVDDIRQELFALHGMERIFDQAIDPHLDKGPFILNHLDLWGANTIVDESLQIQGIIDWEFTGTIPRQVFTPPSWITGHGSIDANKQIHTEFPDVLKEKSKASSLCDQRQREWYGTSDAGKSGIDQTDLVFSVAHVLRR